MEDRKHTDDSTLVLFFALTQPLVDERREKRGRRKKIRKRKNSKELHLIKLSFLYLFGKGEGEGESRYVDPSSSTSTTKNSHFTCVTFSFCGKVLDASFFFLSPFPFLNCNLFLLHYPTSPPLSLGQVNSSISYKNLSFFPYSSTDIPNSTS